MSKVTYCAYQKKQPGGRYVWGVLQQAGRKQKFRTVGEGEDARWKAEGIAVDRCDRALGSPPHALVVATSENLDDTYYPGPKDVDGVTPLLDALHNPDVRADITFFDTVAGGAVFAVGSIAWIGSLSWNEFDNNVATMTRNALRCFLDTKAHEPFQAPG